MSTEKIKRIKVNAVISFMVKEFVDDCQKRSIVRLTIRFTKIGTVCEIPDISQIKMNQDSRVDLILGLIETDFSLLSRHEEFSIYDGSVLVAKGHLAI